MNKQTQFVEGVALTREEILSLLLAIHDYPGGSARATKTLARVRDHFQAVLEDAE